MGILQHIEHQISALNDLIKINNDRIVGYEKATESTTDADLKLLFAKYIEQSKQNKDELTDKLHFLGGDPSTGTSIAGKFYHAWIDVRAKFSKKDRQSILSDCEYGEDVANSSYRSALDDKELIWKSDDIVNMLTQQLKILKDAHDNIRDLRDSAIKLNAQTKRVEKVPSH
jgi:uncharacterized protein (TIGR02284 family)